MNTAHSHSPPLVVTDAAQLRAHVTAARRTGHTIGLVPTMGALHEGHLSLVRRARDDCGLIVVTVFVNPMQFGPGDDFTRYPRTLEADCRLLGDCGTDLVFAPARETMYGQRHATSVDVEGPADPLEGEFRPGHFRGVATVVLKLFNLAQPHRAYFGRKDYQQLLVVRRMVADLDLPIHIEACPTVREPDGLAMSSRNAYLSPDERRRALAISQSLRLAKQLVGEGARDSNAVIARMQQLLAAAELKVDYVAIADPDTLRPLSAIAGPAVALIAARVGTTRLIDNELLC